MNEASVLQLFGMLIGLLTVVIGGLTAALWRHVDHCKDVASALTRIEGIATAVKDEIGDHETGMRGRLHEHAKFLLRHEMELESLKKWKDQK